MSLIGIRDMSVLEEPPMDRVPIQTYVMEYNEELVREAISRELRAAGRRILYTTECARSPMLRRRLRSLCQRRTWHMRTDR